MELWSDIVDVPVPFPPELCATDPPGAFYSASTYPALSILLEAVPRLAQEVAGAAAAWSAWPDADMLYEAGGDWSVIPLLHTFPGNDVSKRTWTPESARFPETTRLLESTFGPTLRTALYSRFTGQTKLEPHRGFSDLAPHVLRVQVPIRLPMSGTCALCTCSASRILRLGEAVVFDDSLVHSAFSTSDEERIVLIMDLARPPQLMRNVDMHDTPMGASMFADRIEAIHGV